MNKNLTPRQRKAIETLLTCGDVSKAAEGAGVSRETLYRWMRQTTFRAGLEEGTKEAIASLSRSLVSLGENATRTLGAAITNQGYPIATRVRAADVVLGRLLQLRELFDLEERVCRLEEQNEESKKQN